MMNKKYFTKIFFLILSVIWILSLILLILSFAGVMEDFPDSFRLLSGLLFLTVTGFLIKYLKRVDSKSI